MDAEESSKTNNDQISDLGQRVARMETNMARMETKMDFMATHKDIAAVRTEMEGTRTEIEGTRTEIASLKGELLTEIAGIKTLVANREASMQRWLLGITTALVRTLLWRFLKSELGEWKACASCVQQWRIDEAPERSQGLVEALPVGGAISAKAIVWNHTW